jgi:hypothetical protein
MHSLELLPGASESSNVIDPSEQAPAVPEPPAAPEPPAPPPADPALAVESRALFPPHALATAPSARRALAVATMPGKREATL